MTRGKTTPTSERGIALVVALFIILLLGALGSTVAFLAVDQTTSSRNYRQLTQSTQIADAGVEKTIEWLTYSRPQTLSSTIFNSLCTPVVQAGLPCSAPPILLSAMDGIAPNYPDSITQAAFHQALYSQTLSAEGMDGSFSVRAKLLRLRAVTTLTGQGIVETWELLSEGRTGDARAQVTAVVEREHEPLLRFAIAATANTGSACPGVRLTGGAYTDSYDSSKGPYGGQNVINDFGDVGANGSVTTSGSNTTIKGTVWVTPSSTNPCSPTFSGEATKGVQQLMEPLDFPAPDPPNPLPPAAAQDCPGLKTPPGATPCLISTMIPGVYGDLEIKSPVTFVGGPAGGPPTVFIINSLKMNSLGTITITGPVVIHLAGVGVTGDVLSMTGNSAFLNPSGKANNLNILYSGSRGIKVTGHSQSAGVLYAPKAEIQMAGNSPWAGALVGLTYDGTGGAAVHFDLALLNGLSKLKGYRFLSHTRNEY